MLFLLVIGVEVTQTKGWFCSFLSLDIPRHNSFLWMSRNNLVMYALWIFWVQS